MATVLRTVHFSSQFNYVRTPSENKQIWWPVSKFCAWHLHSVKSYDLWERTYAHGFRKLVIERNGSIIVRHCLITRYNLVQYWHVMFYSLLFLAALQNWSGADQRRFLLWPLGEVEVVDRGVREMQMSPTCSWWQRSPYSTRLLVGSHDAQPWPYTKYGCPRDDSNSTCEQNISITLHFRFTHNNKLCLN